MVNCSSGICRSFPSREACNEGVKKWFLGLPKKIGSVLSPLPIEAQLQGSWWDYSEKAFYHVVLSSDGSRLRVFATTCSTLLSRQLAEDGLWWMQGDELHANGMYIRKVRIRFDDSTGQIVRKIFQQRAWSTPSSLTLFSPEQERARGKYVSLSSVWKALSAQDTVFIKASWLVQWMTDGKVLPCRQALPAEAIWHPKELQGLVEKFEVFLMALSYCWAAPDHPDASGKQIRMLASILQHRFAVTYQDGSPVYRDAGIFIDWCSLYQVNRGGCSASEQASFQRGLIDVNIWYAHERIESWLLTKVPLGVMPWTQRGWPQFEAAISSVITPDHMLLDIGQYKPDHHRAWSELFKDCKAGRNPPKVPDLFNAELADMGFTVPGDLKQLQDQYTDTFHTVLVNVVELAFSNLDWIDDEALILAEALPHCFNIEKIDLKSNDIGASGAAAIFKAAVTCPKLQVISLTKNPLGDAGAQAISANVAALQSLKTLWLNECDIGDDGIEALMLSIRKCRSLINFYVFDNAITDEGAKVIIDALPECTSLLQFGIGGNSISEDHIEQLKSAWAKGFWRRPWDSNIYVR